MFSVQINSTIIQMAALRNLVAELGQQTSFGTNLEAYTRTKSCLHFSGVSLIHAKNIAAANQYKREKGLVGFLFL